MACCFVPVRTAILLYLASATVALGCPVRLLDLTLRDSASSSDGDAGEFEGLSVVESGIQYLQGLQSPLYVVPALGVYRGGKSLVLNRLRGLQAPYHGGFGVGHGQETFTRGIDVCAEEVEGLGTVVWMDTEGLFSSQDSRSSLGPKIFSLALLFSSTVILNSVKVLNDQFFDFFAEQQQLARVLKQGLAAEGLPQDTLLPGNLSVYWLLSQPIHYSGGASDASVAQLGQFLNKPGDEARARVARDFQHHLHEVPVAVHNSQAWSRLDELADSELSHEYLSATSDLRGRLLAELGGTRPMQAASVVTQLRMYVELVQNERFSASLAKEAFEEGEIGSLCEEFGRATAELAGALPSDRVQESAGEARQQMELRLVSVREEFHLSGDWSRRLEACFHSKATELHRRNGELVLSQWQHAASEVAESGRCFFLGDLVELLRQYEASYGQTFSAAVKLRAVDFGSALQRTRLVECVRLRDFLWPAVPWLIWPACSLYLRGGLVSGVLSMALHAVVLAGVYMLLQMMNQLPSYLDVDYPILRLHPLCLELAMRAPPFVPWGGFARTLGLVGLARSVYKTLRHAPSLGRPGSGHMVSQMLNLELKVNALLKRSETAFKQQLLSAAFDAAEHLETGNARAAALSLMKGVCLFREAIAEDPQLAALSNPKLLRHVAELLQVFRLPSGDAAIFRSCAACAGHRLESLVVSRDWSALFRHMAELLHRMAEAQKAAFKDDISPRERLVASPIRRRATWCGTSDTDCVGTPRAPSIISRAMSWPAAPAAGEEDEPSGFGLEDSLEMSRVSELEGSLTLVSDLDVGSPTPSECEMSLDASMIDRSFDETPATPNGAATPVRNKIGSSAALFALAAVWCSYFALSTLSAPGEEV